MTTYVAVDWSGAESPSAQRRHIVAAVVRDGVLSSLEGGRTRAELIDHLLRLGEQGTDLVVGLDFSFSAPAWFCAAVGADNVEDFWSVVELQAETWLHRCEPPFWGRPGRPKKVVDSELRACESALGRLGRTRPKSIFQIGGAGAVGTGSLRGMPALRHLRTAGWQIWPFDAPGHPMVLEIYPRLFAPDVRKSSPAARVAHLASLGLPRGLQEQAGANEDAFDAVIAALGMARASEALEKLPVLTDPTTLLEGAIWIPDGRMSGSGGGGAALS